jgi:hypothetical protein
MANNPFAKFNKNIAKEYNIEIAVFLQLMIDNEEYKKNNKITKTLKELEIEFEFWSQNKIRKMLDVLQKEKIISSKKDNKGLNQTKTYFINELFIKKYNIVDSENNIKTSNETEKLVTSFSENTSTYRITSLLIEEIKKLDRKANINENTFNNWMKDIDKLQRIDKRTEEEINFVIKWVFKNDFWKTNILSANKLRKQFQRLVIQSKYKPRVVNNTSKLQTGEYKEIKIKRSLETKETQKDYKEIVLERNW